jgi:hypothetical protein
MKQEASIAGSQRLGRPPMNPEAARSKRIVTFITNSDLTKIERIVEQEKSSISLIVHRILSEFLKDL